MTFQSTHSLRSATHRSPFVAEFIRFQSTHSLRSATFRGFLLVRLGVVSIHALLAECDWLLWGLFLPGTRFNPRTPCGVRQLMGFHRCGPAGFQSTHSLRSATMRDLIARMADEVSIHALLAECDRRQWPQWVLPGRFNPRTPCGVRPGRSSCQNPNLQFQSTHSLRSATIGREARSVHGNVSIHALLAECDCARPYTWLLNRANHTLRQPP